MEDWSIVVAIILSLRKRVVELTHRIDGLIDDCNRHINDARAARRERDRARFEADMWSERTLAAWAALRRLDPTYAPEVTP